MAAMSDPAGATSDPAAVVQRQLEAYNARDLEAFLAVFSADVVVVSGDDGSLIAGNREEMRPRYEQR